MENRRQNSSNFGISTRNQLRPGDIGCIIYLHGTLYAMEHGWDYTLEAYVAEALVDFAKSHSPKERIWIVERDGKVVGSVAIVQFSAGVAQLRWLLLAPEVRGLGLGGELVEKAVDFC
jgi:predicted N-acetyltransferase YhbS